MKNLGVESLLDVFVPSCADFLSRDHNLSFICFRSNLKGLYKGDVYSIYNSQKTISPSKPGIVCWMGLTGYQAAIVSLGTPDVYVRNHRRCCFTEA